MQRIPLSLTAVQFRGALYPPAALVDRFIIGIETRRPEFMKVAHGNREIHRFATADSTFFFLPAVYY